MQPGDDILKYFSEETTDQQRKDIEMSIMGNTSAVSDLALLKTIWTEAETMQEMQDVDIDHAWLAVEGKINPDSASRHFQLWPYISVAASIALLVMSALYYLNTDPSYFVETATGENEHKMIRLADGSEVLLWPNSFLRYPKQFDDPDERRIFLRGDAALTVATDTASPFFAENYGAAVRAIGTAFTLESDSSIAGQLSVLENVDGVMQLFEQENPSNERTLYNPGDKAIFDGGEIRYIPLEPPLPPAPLLPPDTMSRDLRIGYILNELQFRFQRRFIVAHQMPVDGHAIARVNFEQDLLSIMVQLDTTANIDYDAQGRIVRMLKFRAKRGN